MRSSAARAALKAEFLEACANVFDQFVPSEGELYGGSFTQIENRAEQQHRFLAALLCEKRLAADWRSNPQAQFRCPKCHKAMRLQNPRQYRCVSSSIGEVESTRPYCVCDGCGFCCAPLDYALAIPPRGPSVARRELVCHAATKDQSFESARETLEHHDHISLSDEAIRKLAESEGDGLVEERNRRVERFFNRTIADPSPAKPIPLLVVVCDGGMVQTRDKAERWKSDKVGCVYDAEPSADPQAVDAEHYRGAEARIKTYVATMEPWEKLGRMLYAEACCRGYLTAAKKLFISDGDNAIRTIRQEHFSDAEAIIDWYHASEHIHDCARAAFPRGSQQAQHWAQSTVRQLWDGKLSSVIAAVTKHSHRLGPPPRAAPDSDPRVVLKRNVGYFTERQQFMDYPGYRAKGWPIGSGVAEASVKQFAKRVKGSEKFWNLQGAEQMLALCALYRSEDGRWDAYWQQRSRSPVDAASLSAPSVSNHRRKANPPQSSASPAAVF